MPRILAGYASSLIESADKENAEKPSMKSYETRIDLPANAKAASIDLLNSRLAYAIDLALVTKQTQWNLKRIQFIGVREMLGTFRSELDSHVDTIADRVVQLGGTALGTSQTVTNKTALKTYPTDIYKIRDHVAALERDVFKQNRILRWRGR